MPTARTVAQSRPAHPRAVLAALAGSAPLPAAAVDAALTVDRGYGPLACAVLNNPYADVAGSSAAAGAVAERGVRADVAVSRTRDTQVLTHAATDQSAHRRLAAAMNPATPAGLLAERTGDPDDRVRRAALLNPATPLDTVRQVLAESGVCALVMPSVEPGGRNSGTSRHTFAGGLLEAHPDQQLQRLLAADPDPGAWRAVAARPDLDAQALETLVSRRASTELAHILATNPVVPAEMLPKSRYNLPDRERVRDLRHGDLQALPAVEDTLLTQLGEPTQAGGEFPRGLSCAEVLNELSPRRRASSTVDLIAARQLRRRAPQNKAAWVHPAPGTGQDGQPATPAQGTGTEEDPSALLAWIGLAIDLGHRSLPRNPQRYPATVGPSPLVLATLLDTIGPGMWLTRSSGVDWCAPQSSTRWNGTLVLNPMRTALWPELAQAPNAYLGALGAFAVAEQFAAADASTWLLAWTLLSEWSDDTELHPEQLLAVLDGIAS